MASADSATTLPNRFFATGIIRRLLFPIVVSHVSRVERRRCPCCHKEPTRESSCDESSRSVDEFGDRMLAGVKELSPDTRKLAARPFG